MSFWATSHWYTSNTIDYHYFWGNSGLSTVHGFSQKVEVESILQNVVFYLYIDRKDKKRGKKGKEGEKRKERKKKGRLQKEKRLLKKRKFIGPQHFPGLVPL